MIANQAAAEAGQPETPVLDVQGLSVSFTQYQKGLHQINLQVISDLTVSVNQGEILAVVGSSGSGKSLLAQAVLGILPKNASVQGTMRYNGVELTHRLKKRLRGSAVSIIPQSVNYLNPLMRVGDQVGRPRSQRDRSARIKIFRRFGLSEADGRLFPFQLSGGMARRVLVASAVIGGARLIVADEPTPGLHPEAVQEALQQLRELADDGAAILLITHDIGTALQVSDRIAVFYSGTTIEVAPAADFYGCGEGLRHPYTKALWRALPENEFVPIPGSQPPAGHNSKGCMFAPRCKDKDHDCDSYKPQMRELRNGIVRCHHAT